MNRLLPLIMDQKFYHILSKVNESNVIQLKSEHQCILNAGWISNKGLMTMWFYTKC